MKEKTFATKIKEFFRTYEGRQVIKLETWTDGGVNMFITLHKDYNSSCLDQFREYVEGFNIDREVDLHRESDKCRSAFTIRESAKDFEAYHEWLKRVLLLMEK